MTLEQVRCDPFPHKPDPGYTHYLIDLRVKVYKPQWLLLGIAAEAVPSRLRNVNIDEKGRWWFGGVPAWRLPRRGETLLKDLPVLASDRPVSDRPVLVVLGSIYVGGKTPEEWIAQGDADRGDRADLRTLRDSESAIVDVFVECAQWMEIRPDDPCLKKGG